MWAKSCRRRPTRSTSFTSDRPIRVQSQSAQRHERIDLMRGLAIAASLGVLAGAGPAFAQAAAPRPAPPAAQAPAQPRPAAPPAGQAPAQPRPATPPAQAAPALAPPAPFLQGAKVGIVNLQ